MAKKQKEKREKYSVGKPSEAGKKDKSIDELLREIQKEFHSINFDPFDITDKAMQFGKALTGIDLYDYQEPFCWRILYAVLTLEGSDISILLARQSGKSVGLAFCIDTIAVLLPALSNFLPDLSMYGSGVSIGLFAPQSDQVWMTYNKCLAYVESDEAEILMSDPEIEATLTHPSRLRLTNGSQLIGQVASKQSKIEGATHHVLVFEENQDIDDYVMEKSIMPMGSSTNATSIHCGTTGISKSSYWEQIQQNKKADRKLKDERLRLHFEYNYLDIIASRRRKYEQTGDRKHLAYEVYIAKMIKKYTKESQAFKLNYLLQWELESGMLISEKDWNKMCDGRKGFSYDEDDVVIGGMDIGKESAPTTICFAKLVFDPDDASGVPAKEIIGWVEIEHGTDYDVQHHQIIDALMEYNCANLVADYTGVGKAVVDRLSAATQGIVNIEPFTFSTQSKSDMWFNLLEHIQSGRLIVPANKVVRAMPEFANFEDQLKACLKGYNGPYLVAQKPEGGFDEHVDALGMMCLGDNFEVPSEIEIESTNMFYPKSQLTDFLQKRMSHGRIN